MVELQDGEWALEDEKRNKFVGVEKSRAPFQTSDPMPSDDVKGARSPVNAELRTAVGLGIKMWGSARRKWIACTSMVMVPAAEEEPHL